MLSQNPNATDEDVEKVVAQYYALPPANTAAAAAHEHALAGGKVRKHYTMPLNNKPLFPFYL